METPPTSHAHAWIWVSWFIFILFLFSPPAQLEALAMDSWEASPEEKPIILVQAEPPSSSDRVVPPAVEDQAAADEEEDVDEGPTRIPLAGVAQGGVLLQRDQLVVEPTLGYSFSTNSRLILTGFSILPLLILGTIEAEKVETTVFSPVLGFRYGIRRGIQFDIRIPYVVQNTTRIRVLSDTTGQGQASGEANGLGDLSFGLSYQFLYERAWIPDMVFRLGATAPTGRSQFDIFQDIIATGMFENTDQFQQQLTAQGSPTGSGRWSINTTVTGVKALDPAILFGTVGFSYSPPVTETLLQLTANPSNPRQIIVQPVESDLGGVSSLSLSLGMAISLNNQLSMNWSFADNYRFSQQSNGMKIPDSQIQAASFNMGFNIAITPRITTNIVGSIGITPDAPDFGFSMTTPVSFTNALGSTITWLKEHRPFKSKPAPAVPAIPGEVQEAPEIPGEPEAPAAPPTQKEPSTGAPSQTGNGNNGPPSIKEPQK